MPTFAISATECDACDASDDGCRYRVAWAINPHMQVGRTDSFRARSQRQRLGQALRQAGADLIEMPFVHGAYDSVFAKDSAILTERAGRRRALLANPRFKERQPEIHHRRETLSAIGFEIESAPTEHLEGGDVVVGPNEAYVGYGFRTDRNAARAVEAHLGVPAYPLRLVNPHLYHLDMALTVLSDGLTFACKEAFDAASIATLKEVAGDGLHFVPLAEALTFALNLIEVGNEVILDGSSATMSRYLRAAGRRIRRTDLSEFHLAGGSAACLVAAVHTGRPAVAVALEACA